MGNTYSPVPPLTEWVASEIAQRVLGTCTDLTPNAHYKGIFTMPLGLYEAIIQNDPGSPEHVRVSLKSPTGRTLVSLYKKDTCQPDKRAEDARRAAVIAAGR